MTATQTTTTYDIRISETIRSEVANRELANTGKSVYAKIDAMTKAGLIQLEHDEVMELHAEGDYWRGYGVEANAGYVKAWRALADQIEKVIA